MTEEPKGKTLSKQHLEIVHYEADVPYSQGTKALDRVQAVNLSLADDDPLAGKTLRMTIFNGDLKTFVRGKSHITADIEERPRQDNPEYGPDRTIVQVYDNGEPVSRKKGGGQYQRRSLEDDLALEAFKRVSIEGQTSVAQVGALLAVGANFEKAGLTPEAWGRILLKYWKAVEKGLDNYLAEPKAPAPKPDQRPQNQKSAPEKPTQVSKDTETENGAFKNFGEVLTRASKLKPPVTRAELMKTLELTEGQSPTDLAAAWSKAEELSFAKHEAAVDKEAAPSRQSDKLL